MIGDSNTVKLGATFLLVSETIKAFPTFSAPLSKVRHIDPGTEDAKDARIGYSLAIAWSLFVAMAIGHSTRTEHVIVTWAVLAGAMVLYYEWAIRHDNS